MKDIKVFICEDDDTYREIVGNYLVAGKVTYVASFKPENRADIVYALDQIV